MKKEYRIVGSILLASLFILVFINLFTQVQFLKDLSLNLISELVGILATVYVVELIFIKHHDKREKELEKKQKYYEWKDMLEKDKQYLVRFLDEVAELISIANESLVKGEKANFENIRLKLTNPPLCYSFGDNRLNGGSKQVLSDNLHRLNSLQADLKAGITSKQLTAYRIAIKRSIFDILQISDDIGAFFHRP